MKFLSKYFFGLWAAATTAAIIFILVVYIPNTKEVDVYTPKYTEPTQLCKYTGTEGVFVLTQGIDTASDNTYYYKAIVINTNGDTIKGMNTVVIEASRLDEITKDFSLFTPEEDSIIFYKGGR